MLRTLAGIGLFVLLVPAGSAAQRLSVSDRSALVAETWSAARAASATLPRLRVNWDSALADGLRSAAAPQSDVHFIGALRTLLARLDDAQADVLPPPPLRARLARPPIVVASVERRAFVVDYAENDEMRLARPPRLSEILAVQGVPLEAWVRDSVLPAYGGASADTRWDRAVAGMLEGERGTALHLALEDPRGGRRGVSVTRSVSLSDRWPLEPPPLSVDSLPAGQVVVRFHGFAPDVVTRFDRALPTFAGIQGMVIDLRDAFGGRVADADALLARLDGQPFVSVIRKFRVSRPGWQVLAQPESAATWQALALDTLPPRRDPAPFTGPIAWISGSATRGAAEDLLASARGAGRGVIVGTLTAGSPDEPLVVPLEGGWSVELSAVRDSVAGGGAVSGVGVAPDYAVSLTVDDLLAGRDAALERARAYLATPPKSN